jgi:hypothetical protein
LYFVQRLAFSPRVSFPPVLLAEGVGVAETGDLLAQLEGVEARLVDGHRLPSSSLRVDGRIEHLHVFILLVHAGAFLRHLDLLEVAVERLGDLVGDVLVNKSIIRSRAKRVIFLLPVKFPDLLLLHWERQLFRLFMSSLFKLMLGRKVIVLHLSA